jgi:hypothetical protein
MHMGQISIPIDICEQHVYYRSEQKVNKNQKQVMLLRVVMKASKHPTFPITGHSTFRTGHPVFPTGPHSEWWGEPTYGYNAL